MATKTKDTTKPPKQTPKGQTLTNLVRRVRKILGGKVERIDLTTYRVNDRATVSFNYFCFWGKDKDNQIKECHPSSITVKPLTKMVNERFRRSVNSSAVARTVTISKLANGDFNLERVAVAVTSCCEGVDRFIRDRLQCEQQEKERKQLLENKTKELVALLPVEFAPKVNRRFGDNTIGYKYGNDYKIQVWISEDDDNPEDVKHTYNVSIEGMPRHLIVNLATVAFEQVKEHERLSKEESNTRSGRPIADITTVH